MRVAAILSCLYLRGRLRLTTASRLRRERFRPLQLLVLTFLDSFWNKSGKPQPIRTKVGTHAQVKGRQRSQNCGHDRLSGGEMGAKKCPRRRSFFVRNTRWLLGNFTTADFRQIWQRGVNRGWNADFIQKFMQSFYSGVICPENPKLWRGQTGTYSEQTTGQGMHCREIMFIPRCSPGTSGFPRLFCTTYGCGPAENKFAQFSDFGLSFPYKNL